MFTPTELETLGRIIAREIISNQNNSKVLISQNEAFRRYGRTKIEELKRQNRLTVYQTGNRIQYKSTQIEKLI